MNLSPSFRDRKFLSTKISLDRCGCAAILGLEKAA
jgi:hypothetical protein